VFSKTAWCAWASTVGYPPGVKLLPSLALISLVACGGNEATKPVAPRAEPSAPGAPASPGTPQAPTAKSVPLELSTSVERSSDGVGLHVINRGSTSVSLAADVVLEKKAGEGYAAVAGQLLKLRLDCASQGCVTLAPGGELIAPVWLGRPDGERCDAQVQASDAGSYRFVVRACTGAERVDVPFVVVPLPPAVR
jgi:hypothetical protein